MYIAIAGNIGSGKTTLTRILTERYNAKAYLEECNNPYIGDFYEDMNRWSFNLQIYFLGSRIQQTMDMLADNRDSGAIFQDRTIYEDAHIFADNLHQQIRKRGREYEMNIDELYLKRLNDKYNNWIDNIYEGDVLVVDKDHEDFVSDPTVLEKICARLDALENR